MENQEQNKFDVFLEKTKDMAQSVEMLSKSLLADQEVRKQEAELRKSELDAQAELKKSELASENEALKKELEMKKSQMNFAKYSGVNYSSPSEKVLMKSETKDGLNAYFEKASALRGGASIRLDSDTSKELGNYIVSGWLEKSASGYANDANAYGGYLQQPTILPVTNQTNYTNTEKLFDLIGVSQTVETTAIKIPQYVYDYETETSRVKARGEGEAYSYDDAEGFLRLQTVELQQLSYGKRMSRDFVKLNPQGYNFIISEYERNIRRKVSENLIKTTAIAGLKNIDNIPVVTASQLPANVKETAGSVETILTDIIVKMMTVATLRPDRIMKPMFILNRTLISKLMFAYNNFQYHNLVAGILNPINRTILTAEFGAVPYISIADENLLKDSTAGEVSCIFMDADAYKIFVNPLLSEFTSQDPHISHVNNEVTNLMTMSIASKLIDVNRVVVLKVKA